MVILGIGYNWVYHTILNDSISASWWMAMMPSKTQKLFTGRCSLLIQGTISFQHQNCEISRRQWVSHLEPESVIPRRDIVTHTTHTPIESWTCIAIAIKWADLVPLAPPAVQWKIWDLKLDCSILKLTGQSMVCETLIFFTKTNLPIYTPSLSFGPSSIFAVCSDVLPWSMDKIWATKLHRCSSGHLHPPPKKKKHDRVDQSLVTCLGSQHVRKKRGFFWHARAQKVPVWIYSRGHPVVDTFWIWEWDPIAWPLNQPNTEAFTQWFPSLQFSKSSYLQ